jgi:hypothetical protein
MKRFWRNSILMLLVMLGLYGCALAASNASITVSSTGTPVSSPGSITVAFGDSMGHIYSETVPYGQYSSPACVASWLAAMFSSSYLCPSAGNCTGGLGAHASGSVVTFQLNGGASFRVITVSGPTNAFSIPTTSWPYQTSDLDTPTVHVSAADVPYGQDPTVDIVVSNSNGDVPTGTVTLTIQNTGLTPFTLPSPPVQLQSGTSSASATWTSCAQECALYPVEAYSVTAQYSGDTNDAPESGSTAFSVAPDNTNTTIQSGCPGSAAAGQNSTYTVQVAAQNADVDGMATPSGDVSLFDYPPSGQSVNWTQTLGGGSGTSATTNFSIALQGTGTHTLKASYNGDGNYATSTSNECQVGNSVTCNYVDSDFYCDDFGDEWENDLYSCSDGSSFWTGWYLDGNSCGGGVGEVQKGSLLKNGPLILRGPMTLH